MRVTCSVRQAGKELAEGAQATSYPPIWRDMIMQIQSIQDEVDAELPMDLQASTAVL